MVHTINRNYFLKIIYLYIKGIYKGMIFIFLSKLSNNCGFLSAIIDNKYKMSVIVVLNLYHNYRYIYFSENLKIDYCSNLCTFIIDSKYEMHVMQFVLQNRVSKRLNVSEPSRFPSVTKVWAIRLGFVLIIAMLGHLKTKSIVCRKSSFAWCPNILKVPLANRFHQFLIWIQILSNLPGPSRSGLWIL